MIKRGGNFLLLILLAVSGIMSACTQERSPCYEPTIVYAQLGTYRLQDTSSVDSLLPNPVIAMLDSPYLVNFPNPKNKFSVIFSPKADSFQYYLIPDTANKAIEPIDTLTFYYTRELTFISNACGYTYYYTLNDIRATHNSIDSISIIDRDVNDNINIQHVKIYF